MLYVLHVTKSMATMEIRLLFLMQLILVLLICGTSICALFLQFLSNIFEYNNLVTYEIVSDIHMFLVCK